MREFALKHQIFGGPLGPWLRLMRFDRPIGLMLLLWPTGWGLWAAASGWPSLKNALIFTAGVIVMRAAGCVINDYLDRDIDPLVARTQHRPLATGEIKPRSALIGFFVLMAMALGLVLMTNGPTILLAIVGALLAGTYPLFKRIIHLPQTVLGLAFSWAIPMAFTAETGTLTLAVLPWMALNTLWVLIYDTEYAMADREDDLKVGIKSSAIALGRHDVLGIVILMLAMLSIMGVMGMTWSLGLPWWIAMAGVTVLFYRQWRLIKNRDPQHCFDAFLGNHWVGLVIFMGLVLSY